MKLSRFLFLIGIALLPLLSGCPDTKSVTTTINKDGSCIRTIGDFDSEDFKGIDSVKHDIPIPVDEGWELVNINDSTALLRREFGSMTELNELYSSDESELKMYKRNVKLEKKFRWFHTVFQYSESYDGLLTEIPITNYMSEDEAEVFKSNSPQDHPLLENLDKKSQNSLSDNIEERFGYWLHDNIYSLAFDDIVEIIDSLGLINAKSINVIELKDSVKYLIDQGDKQLMTFDDDQMPPVDVAELIGIVMDLDSSSIGILKEKVYNSKLDEKYENEILGGFGEEYDNNIIMPGVLTDTNAEILKSDTLTWLVGPIKFIDSDYVMYAESKVTNRWAYILSGFILTIAIIIPFLKKKKA